MAFRVVLIDDSKLVREILREILEKIEGVQVCGEASNGRDGVNRVILDRPDLVIMDVEMPVMNGLEALQNMRERGIMEPVIMVSVLTQRGAEISFRTLELGALDFVPKPSRDSGFQVSDVEELLTGVVEGVMQEKSRTPFSREVFRKKNLEQGESQPREKVPPKSNECSLLIIGASTGGPRALQEILRELPGDFPIPIALVQHMPPVFTAAFADRLDRLSHLHISEAVEGPLFPGHVYVAPGDKHLLIEKDEEERPWIRLSGGPRVNSHRPSIDVTLRSAVSSFGGRAAALIMTGMGKDGMDGMIKLHNAGGRTYAQDEASSVVFGMNRRVIEAGVVDEILELDRIALSLTERFLRAG